LGERSPRRALRPSKAGEGELNKSQSNTSTEYHKGMGQEESKPVKRQRSDAGMWIAAKLHNPNPFGFIAFGRDFSPG
jgi:hypothetical protein